MIVPDWNPRKVPMTELQIQITTVSGVAFAVVFQGVDFRLWLWNTVDRLSVAIVTISRVFIDVVAKVDHVVHAILPRRVAVRIEETEGVVGAAIYREADIGDMIVSSGSGFRSADWAGLVAIAHFEPVVVPCEWGKPARFNLHSVVNVAAGVDATLADGILEILCFRDPVVSAHGSCGDREVCAVAVKRNRAVGRVVTVCGCRQRRETGPKNYRVRIRIAGGYAVSEVQLRGIKFGRRAALVDLVKRNTEARVMF